MMTAPPAPLPVASILVDPSPPPAPAAAEEVPPRVQIPSPTVIAAHVRAAAARHGVPESLVAAVISVESEYNPRAISRRGARGLMQLMPTTAAMLGVRDAFDPAQNVDAGARHLRDLLDRFANDVVLALAAYNAGAQAVVEHGGVPPFPETRAFVARVLSRVGRLTMPAVANGDAALPRVRPAVRRRQEAELVIVPAALIDRDDVRALASDPPAAPERRRESSSDAVTAPTASRVEAP
jgi:hypothetical protein